MGFNGDSIRVELIAQEIFEHFTETETGHCARVDFLHRIEAAAICEYIAKNYQKERLIAYVLTTQHAEAQDNSVYITADKAIERRNRKQHRLCLFVPTDLVDAAYSSLSNAFAVIDGRKLHASVLKRLVDQLSLEGQRLARTIFAHLRGIPTISDEQRLDFVVSLLERQRLGTLDQVGLDLWRVGLIADASTEFLTKLGSNRECVLKLARPKKLDATVYERVQNLKVDLETASRLGNFFSGRAMHDVRAWSYDLVPQKLTFDQWVFPQVERSDIRRVMVTPFINARGDVEKWSRLLQPDGPSGSLRARCGPKEKLVVRWKCEPEQPRNLDQWRVSIVPIGTEHDERTIELPELDVPGKRRNTTIKLDLEFDEPPDIAVCVRVVPLKVDGSEIVDEETAEIIAGESYEFFLVKDDSMLPPSTPKEGRTTTPTLAYGRIEEALKIRDSILEEREPQWGKDQNYFSLRIHDRRLLSIGFSTLLLQLERSTISNSRKGGCFLLKTHEVRLASIDECTPLVLQTSTTEAWAAFWKARDTFFSRLQKASPRDVVEIAEWTSDQSTGALRYAQAYHELLDNLVSQKAPLQDLREAASIDTLLVRIYKHSNLYEEALIILPTHPLRIAWLISYHVLLRGWEAQLFNRSLPERKNSIDLQALRLLVPTNIPPFAFHVESPQHFTFFQNMRFFYGIALPAGVPDPHRRYEDIVAILDTGMDQISMGDMQPDHLAEHLLTFQKRHPYTDTLVTTLINPDRGDFFAEALRKVFSRLQTEDEDERPSSFPLFQITAFVEDKQRSTLQAIGNIRQQQIEQNNGITRDYFLPGLMIISKSMQQLDRTQLPEAHIAVITDFTRPQVVFAPLIDGENDEITSTAFYGLINRFVSLFTTDRNGLLWQHKIVPEISKKPEVHPFGSKYSEILNELQTSLLHAQGYILSGQKEMHPVLEVRLEASQRGLLDRLHASTNWVITLDRFFTLDYYDSPHTPGLDDVARKYVLDYSPEFTEGLGHRMMVTTAWHEELGSLLGQVMDEMGLASVEQSVSQLLHYLKTVSGRLALQALESSTNAAAAVGLGVVTAWLQRQGRLKQAIIIPVDAYPRLFSQAGSGRPAPGERRCDLVLVALKRNVVDATFIEVKWRRGQALFEELAMNMVFQMHATERAMRARFFDDTNRVDGALQRAYLANVLRFYFERSRRYNLFDKKAEAPFLEHIARLEKTGLDFRATHEGYIVNLENEPRKPLLIDNAKITILTAHDFESTPEFLSSQLQNSLEDEESMPFGELNEERLQEQKHQEQADPIPNSVHQNREAQEKQEEGVLNNHDQEQSQHRGTPLIVPLGEASGASIDWMPSVQGSPHLFILGIPGQGKSWAIIRILSELGRQQVPSLVLDFHGQFADQQSPLLQKIHPVILDASKGLPFSPFECSSQVGWSDWKANTQAISEIIAYVAGLGDMQRDVVFTAIRDAYKAHGFDTNSPDETLSGEDLDYPTMSEIMRRIEQHEQTRHIPNVIARCRPLLEMDLFRPIQPASDLLKLVRTGCVIDLHNLYAETLQMAAGAFVLRKLYKDMFHWGYADRIRLAVVLDEAHRLAKDITLPKLMKEGRKFGIAVIVASQGIGDFHQDVLSNAGTKVIFRMNYPESKKAAGFMRARQGQDVTTYIEQLSVGSAYVQTPNMVFGTIVRMKPLV